MKKLPATQWRTADDEAELAAAALTSPKDLAALKYGLRARLERAIEGDMAAHAGKILFARKLYAGYGPQLIECDRPAVVRLKLLQNGMGRWRSDMPWTWNEHQETCTGNWRVDLLVRHDAVSAQESKKLTLDGPTYRLLEGDILWPTDWSVAPDQRAEHAKLRRHQYTTMVQAQPHMHDRERLKPRRHQPGNAYDLKNLHTSVLLGYLATARACGCGGVDPTGNCNEHITIDEIKKELATREHLPNKVEAKKLRQDKAKASKSQGKQRNR